MIYKTRYQSPIGELLLAAEENALIGLWLEKHRYYLNRVKGEVEENDAYPVLLQTKAWLDRYFAGEGPAITELQLAPLGSDFQRAVCEIMCNIPYGKVITYGEIAKEMALRLGKERMSAQAVGGAVGHNTISIIIPCHRVVGATGSLTGYGGGIDNKIWLLKHEGVDMSKLFRPKKTTAP